MKHFFLNLTNANGMDIVNIILYLITVLIVDKKRRNVLDHKTLCFYFHRK